MTIQEHAGIQQVRINTAIDRVVTELNDLIEDIAILEGTLDSLKHTNRYRYNQALSNSPLTTAKRKSIFKAYKRYKAIGKIDKRVLEMLNIIVPKKKDSTIKSKKINKSQTAISKINTTTFELANIDKDNMTDDERAILAIQLKPLKKVLESLI